MSKDLRELFDELVEDQPHDTIDLDRQITRGRRRARYRTAGAAGLATVAVLGIAAGAVVLRPAGAPPQPAGQPGPDARATVRTFGPSEDVPGVDMLWFDRSTATSRQLAAQLRELVPELSGSAQYTPSDSQGRRGEAFVPQVWAGFDVTVAGFPDPATVFRAKVGDATQNVQVICTSMEPVEGKGVCKATERTLPDGRVAQLYAYEDGGVVRRGVRLVRPDGVQVAIEVGMLVPDGTAPIPQLSADRLLEIAQAITVVP
jgi:hypothetical protein